MTLDPLPESIILEVFGVPAPQGSKQAMVTKSGKAVVVEGKAGQRERFKSWREGVANSCREWLRLHPMPALSEPVHINVAFHFLLPKSDPYRTRHDKQPDLDKLLRSTFDGLVFGAILADDNIICSVSARKVYSAIRPGATIEIIALGDQETVDRERKKAEARRQRMSNH